MNDMPAGDRRATATSARSLFGWLSTLLALMIAGYFSLGAAVWCWEGAYNVLQGHSPNYGSSAVLLVAGLLPFAAGAAYRHSMRRSGQSQRSSLAFAAFVALVTSLFVLVFRAGAGGGF